MPVQIIQTVSTRKPTTAARPNDAGVEGNDGRQPFDEAEEQDEAANQPDAGQRAAEARMPALPHRHPDQPEGGERLADGLPDPDSGELVKAHERRFDRGARPGVARAGDPARGKARHRIDPARQSDRLRDARRDAQRRDGRRCVSRSAA